MRELDKFIAASDERIQKKQHFGFQQNTPEKEDANKKSAETSMAQSLAASIEPELLAILKRGTRDTRLGIGAESALPSNRTISISSAIPSSKTET